MQSYNSGTFRFTVMDKIVAIVGVCILLVVGASATGILKIREIGTEIEFIANSEVPLTKAISVVTAHRLEQSLLMERLFRYKLSGQTEASQQVKETREHILHLTHQIEHEFREATEIAQAAILNSSAGSQAEEIGAILETLKEVSSEQIDYANVAQKALALASIGNDQRAQKVLQTVEKRHAELDHELEDVLIRVQTLAENAARAAYEHEQSAIQFAIFLCGGSIVLSLMLAVLLGRRAVSQPLLEVVRALKQLSSNDFGAELSTDRNDEIGEIGRAYKALKNRLKESQEQERNERERQQMLNREIKLMAELNEWLQSSNSMDELFGLVSKFLEVLLPGCRGEIYVYSNSRDVLDGECAWNGAKIQDQIRPSECWGLRRGRSYVQGDGEVDIVCEHVGDQETEKYVCIPFLAHGETLGLMHLTAVPGISNDEFLDQRKLAQMAAEQISLAIANTRMRDELHNQSIRDSLTGLFNRRHFLDKFRIGIDRAKHSGSPVSLVSFDVDHFKKFNDNHGHDAGDMVLRSVGTILDQMFEGEDLPCRVGGEEFVVLLPEKTPEQAVEIAEKLRQRVSDLVVRYGEKKLPRITISSGIASYPLHGLVPQDILKTADDALYSSKGAGRNCVTLADINKSEELWLDEAFGEVEAEARTEGSKSGSGQTKEAETERDENAA